MLPVPGLSNDLQTRSLSLGRYSTHLEFQKTAYRRLSLSVCLRHGATRCATYQACRPSRTVSEALHAYVWLQNKSYLIRISEKVANRIYLYIFFFFKETAKLQCQLISCSLIPKIRDFSSFLVGSSTGRVLERRYTVGIIGTYYGCYRTPFGVL